MSRGTASTSLPPYRNPHSVNLITVLARVKCLQLAQLFKSSLAIPALMCTLNEKSNFKKAWFFGVPNHRALLSTKAPSQVSANEAALHAPALR